MTRPEVISVEPGTRVTAHALNVGDRINTMGFEGETLSAVPLAIRVGKTGVAVLFRYGVVVLIGVSLQDESGFLEKLTPRIGGKRERFEEETATVVVAGETEDQVQAGGPIQLRAMSPERFLVISNVLAKSVELAGDFARSAAGRLKTREAAKRAFTLTTLCDNAHLVKDTAGLIGYAYLPSGVVCQMGDDIPG